jgi:DNA-binding NarL/FixJ family response regulator
MRHFRFDGEVGAGAAAPAGAGSAAPAAAPPGKGRVTDPLRTLGLTAREDEVLGLLARGYTNRQIAGELTISVKTAASTCPTSCASWG